MRASACMWGGIFNPIIPVFRTAPREWRRKFKTEVTGFDIAKGYIEFFEPDAFVLADPGLIKAVGLTKLKDEGWRSQARVIGLEDLLKPEPNKDWSELAFGQSMIDALKDIYDKEQRFLLRNERASCLVSTKRGSLLTEALFGAYPTEKFADYFERGFVDVYKPERLSPGPEAWRKVISGSITPLRATRYGIDLQRSWRDELVIFIFDPKRLTDLIDLWNMRLEPSPLLPVPITWFGELTDEIKKIILAEYRPLQGNPYGVMHHATVEFSRSISQQQINSVTDVLRKIIPPDKNPEKGPGPLVLKTWRNSVWESNDDDLTRSRSRLRVVAKERWMSLPVSDDPPLRTNFETLSPDFAAQYGGQNFRWVNTAQLSAYGTQRAATVIPFNTLDRSWPRLVFGGDEVVVGTEGWAFGQRLKGNAQHIELMSHEEAIIGSFKRLGIEAKLSEPGHIAKQILEHLKGLWSVNLLADTETLKLLNTMAGGIRRRISNTGKNAQEEKEETEELFDRRSKPIHQWIDLVARRAKGHPSITLEQFTERNIIRLGIQTTCSHCLAANWHSIDAAGYELTCERCLKRYAFPQAQLRKNNRNWAYRVVGPFSVPDYARGSYGALLALNVIRQFTSASNPMTFSPALSLNFDGIAREADFVAWHASDLFDRANQPDLLIGESKSLGEGDLFSADDISKMRDIGEKLPGAMLIFSVIRSDFTQREKQLLHKIVRWGRRLDSRGGPTNRVLLLTSNEMFKPFSPLGATWKNLGGQHEKYSDFHFTRNLHAIAESTVAIYLGLPSFEQERQSAWERRRQRQGGSKSSSRPPGKIGRMLIAPRSGES